MIDHSLKTVKDQESGEGKADHDPDDGNDGYPFLTRVLLVHPWPFHFTFLDSPRMEVSLGKDLLVEVNRRR